MKRFHCSIVVHRTQGFLSATSFEDDVRVIRCVCIFSIQYSLVDDCFDDDGEKAAAEPARARIVVRQNFIVFFLCVCICYLFNVVVVTVYYDLKWSECEWRCFFRKINESVSVVALSFLGVFKRCRSSLLYSLVVYACACINNTKLVPKPRTRLDE
jgi:hypothetical protein